MIQHILIVVVFFFVIIGFGSCSENTEEFHSSETFKKQNPITLDYAKGFSVDTIEGGLQRVTIQDLASSQNIATYILVPKGSSYSPLNDDEVVYTPIENIGILSSSYIGFLDALNQVNNISIIENHTFIYNEELRNKYLSGTAIEVGSTGQINLEKLVINSPEVLFTSVFNGGLSNELLKAKEAGIVSIQCSEWQENHPLARAEWIKLFGALTDQEEKADSLFNEIAENYKSIISKCNNHVTVPKVLFSSMYQDVWYMPGGKSYMAQILADVNATYAWADNDQVGSLHLSFENVASKSLQNDVWINPEVSSLGELLSRDVRYENFVKNITNGIFQQNARITSDGGNDYWESGVVRPDWVLQDFGKMMHPELFESTTFVYFKKLQ